MTQETAPDKGASTKRTAANHITVRLAQNGQEIERAQRLRYKVFYEEYAAVPSPEAARLRRDFDHFDAITDHLVVLDETLPAQDNIVGTYRLLRRDIAENNGGFYTSSEYDISALLESGQTLLELGRSCVLSPYRTKLVIQKLWEGIARYVAEHDIDMMFGCASLHGTDIDALSKQLAYLYHHHLAADGICSRALEERYVDMNLHPKEDLNAKEVFMSLPPLVKGYIRLGACVGDGAVIDHQFDTTDVCIIMPVHRVTGRYIKHYQRVTENGIGAQGAQGAQDALHD